MKIKYYYNLGAAIPRASKLSILVFNHAFFIGESNKIGSQLVLCSWQHTKEGFKRTWFRWIP